MNNFIPVQYLGSKKEVSEIVTETIEVLEAEYKIKISHEQLVPAFVDCFLNAAYYNSIDFIKTRNNQEIELNLFDLFRIIHTIDDDLKLKTSIELGRMGMRKLDIEFDEGMETEESEKMATLDATLLETICIRACEYLENNHSLKFKHHLIMFKICEVFFGEVLEYVKEQKVEGDTITILDQFTILVNDDKTFDSIEITLSQQEIINQMFEEKMNKLKEDEEELDEK